MKKIGFKKVFWFLFNALIAIWCILELLTNNFGQGNPNTFICIVILVLNFGSIVFFVLERRQKK